MQTATGIGQGPSALTPIDARPIRPTSSDTCWDRAVALRDELAHHMRAALAAERIDALVFSSANGNYPPWVKLEAWLPSPRRAEGRERSELLLVIDAKPYNRALLVINAQATRGSRSIRVEERPAFSASDVWQWTRYALHRAGKPSNYHPFLDALIGLLRWYRNPIDRAYRNPWRITRTGLLGLASLLVLLVAFAVAAEVPELTLVLGVLGIAGLIAALVLTLRRRHAVFVPEQPIVPPRNLGLVDSWHAVIADLGREFAELKSRLVRSIGNDLPPGLVCQGEVYGYRTPNGYEERERLVVSKGQAVVQVHIYRFSDDLFVGWDAYLNWAQWNETAAVSRKAEPGQLVQFRELRRGYYVPNLFDLIDLNSLSELVHRRIERELKAILKEKEIDQEIDFTIIRGDRDAALDRARHADPAASRRGWRYLSAQPS